MCWMTSSGLVSFVMVKGIDGVVTTGLDDAVSMLSDLVSVPRRSECRG